MSRFECVPNFSEGRDPAKIDRIAGAAREVPDVTVLDVERNADHNRCVISLVGEGDALIEAVLRMMRVATASIDLTHHTGEHPRMGATDVVPFVPLGSSTMADAVKLAERLGERIAKELLLKPGIRVSPLTVRKYLPPRPMGRPNRDLRWSTFLRLHGHAVIACDFFVAVTAALYGGQCYL